MTKRPDPRLTVLKDRAPHHGARAGMAYIPFGLLLHSLLLWLLLGTSVPALASTQLTEPQQAFLDAYQAIKRHDRPAVARYKTQLQNHPLYPYVLYHDYRLNFDRTPVSLIMEFVKQNQNNYLGDRLYTHWLTYLGENRQWPRYLQHYTPQQTEDLQCYYVRAQAASKRFDEVNAQAKSLWISAYPLSQACAPVDTLLRQHKKLTGSMIWQRIELAMQKNQLTLAKILSKDLSKQEREMFQNWLEVYRSPQKIAAPLPASIDPMIRKSIFMQAVTRLASRDAQAARQSLARYHTQYGLSEAQRHELERNIALRSAYRYDENAEEYLQTVNTQGLSNEESLRWQAQIALKNSNWGLLLQTIELMPPEQRADKQWQYWQARALAATGQEQRAHPIYQTLAKQRHFYAFLAADILKQDYQFNPDPQTPVDTAALIQKYPQLQRMRELLAVDWKISAKREWYSLLDQLEADELHAVAVLTSQWQEHSLAISTAAKANRWNDLAIRFPTPHKTPVMQSADKHGVDPAWVYGVIRRESAFSPDIRSSAGAVGLMQLMPRTAQYIGRQIGIKKTSHRVLTQPESNIELGSAYLSYLHKKYQGNQVLATAAYNAGPNRIDSWRPQAGSLPADQWIDSIPFSETRAYVKAVLEYTTIFKSLLNKQYDRLQDIMPPITAGD